MNAISAAKNAVRKLKVNSIGRACETCSKMNIEDCSSRGVLDGQARSSDEERMICAVMLSSSYPLRMAKQAAIAKDELLLAATLAAAAKKREAEDTAAAVGDDTVSKLIGILSFTTDALSDALLSS